jgi:hypothetical protein
MRAALCACALLWREQMPTACVWDVSGSGGLGSTIPWCMVWSGLVCGRKPKHCTASWSWGKGRSLLTDLVCRISEKERGFGLLEPLMLLFGCKRKPCVLHSFCCEQLLDPAMSGTPSSSSTNTDGPYTQVNEFPFISALFIVWEWEIIFFGI